MNRKHEHKPGHDATCTFVVKGMDCWEEVGLLKKRLAGLRGVCCVEANLVAQQARVVHDASLTDARQIQSAIAETGLQALPLGAPRRREATRPLITGIAGALALAAYGISHTAWAQATVALYVLAILTAGMPVAFRGLRALKMRTADMNLLMTVAVIGAAALGDWPEAATVTVLFSLANLLESYSADRARNAIRALMQSAPRNALAKTADGLVQVPVESLSPGDVVVIRPGERVPLDGRVKAGHSAVNQAPLTGEPVPVEKGPGDEVWAGSVNGRGSLEVEVTRRVQDSTIARITRMVEEAQGHRAPVQKFADRFAAVYTPVVMGLAGLVMVVPVLAFGKPFAEWFYRGLVILVIACPCALVISTPVTIVSALASAARAGVLIKGGLYLEQLGSLKVIAVDKTGTLTRGVPEVSAILPLNDQSESHVLALAAAVAARSEHPLAGAIVDKAHQQGLQVPEASGFHSLPGLGATAQVGDKRYYLGSPRFFRETGRLNEEAEEAVQWLEGSGATVVLFGAEDRVLAAMGVSDSERPGAASAIAELQSLVGRTVMLTGDGYRTATAVASRLGVTEWRSDLLPEDKLKAVQELVEQQGRVGMVGDGVNDAPALAAATVGIAMGAAGTDVALETADVALMGDELGHLPFAIRLSRRAMRVVWFNVAFALAVKAAFLAVAVAGLATLWMAVAADMGASLFVTLNALRLLRAQS